MAISDDEKAALEAIRAALAEQSAAGAGGSPYLTPPGAPATTDLSPSGTPVVTDLSPARPKLPDYGGGAAAAGAVGQGVTSGFSAKGGALVDTFLSKLPGPLRDQLEKANAAGGGHPGLSPLNAEPTPSFSDRLIEYNNRNDANAQNHPGIDLAGKMAGGVLQMGTGAPLGAGAGAARQTAAKGMDLIRGPLSAPTGLASSIGRAAIPSTIAGAGYSHGDPTTLEGLAQTGTDAVTTGATGALVAAPVAAGASFIRNAPKRAEKSAFKSLTSDAQAKYTNQVYDEKDAVMRTVMADKDIRPALGKPAELLRVLPKKFDADNAVTDGIYAEALANDAAAQSAARAKPSRSAVPEAIDDDLAATTTRIPAESMKTVVYGKQAGVDTSVPKPARPVAPVNPGVPVVDVMQVFGSTAKEFRDQSRDPRMAAAVDRISEQFRNGIGKDPAHPPSPLQVREFLSRDLQKPAKMNDPNADAPPVKEALQELAGRVRTTLHAYVEKHAPGRLPDLEAANKRLHVYSMIEDVAADQARRQEKAPSAARQAFNVLAAPVSVGGAGAVIGAKLDPLDDKIDSALAGAAIGMGAKRLAPVANRAMASKLGQFTAGAASPAATQAWSNYAEHRDPVKLSKSLTDHIFGDAP